MCIKALGGGQHLRAVHVHRKVVDLHTQQAGDGWMAPLPAAHGDQALARTASQPASQPTRGHVQRRWEAILLVQGVAARPAPELLPALPWRLCGNARLPATP